MPVRVFVGNVAADATETELGEHFNKYNPSKIWVARKPPGFAFIDFPDERDADDAVRKIDGINGWRVEISRNRRDGGGGGRGGGGDGRCYQCGEPGHFARECTNGGGGRDRDRGGRDRYGGGRDRYDDRDRYDRRRDDDRDRRRRSRTPPRRRSPSRSPRRRSPSPRRRASPSPSPARRYSRSPSR